MVRLVAVLSTLVGTCTLLLFFHVVGKGPWEPLESRHLREMKDREATPAHVEATTTIAMFTLPRNLSVAEYSGIERRAVSLDCRVRVMMRAEDGDIHLECLAPEGRDARYVTAEITPAWRGQLPQAGIDSPGWGYEQLAAVFRPTHGTTTPWSGGPARVRLSGWLLDDNGGDIWPRFLHLAHLPRTTDWEIHPVTKIERWDAALASWVEVRR